MAVSKQHFEMFARIIRIAREHGTWDDNPEGLAEMMDSVCVECEKENPRFDRARFEAACEEQEDRRKPTTDTTVESSIIMDINPDGEEYANISRGMEDEQPLTIEEEGSVLPTVHHLHYWAKQEGWKRWNLADAEPNE